MMAQKFCQKEIRAGAIAITALLFAVCTTVGSSQDNKPSDNGPGITYMHDEVADVPWSIHVVKISRHRKDFRLETTLGRGKHLGMSLLSDQVKSVPGQPGRALAAVNGDFYKSENNYAGDPEGLQIAAGELVSAPSSTRSCFWIDAEGQPRHTNVLSGFKARLADNTLIPFGLNESRSSDEAVLYTAANGTSTRTSGGIELVLAQGSGTNWLPLRAGEIYTATVREVRRDGNSPLTRDTMVFSVGSKAADRVASLKAGDTITLSTGTIPDVKGSPVAIGGGPALVRGGKAVSFGGLQPRHPRVAMGWNKSHYFLVEVDGRQKISAGMTFPELAAYMVKIGCDEAINLDGGGSATIWVYGSVMNSPSEGRERPAANGLVVVRNNDAD